MSNNINEAIVRPVEPEDAAQLRENCFSMNTLVQVERRIAVAVEAFDQQLQALFVAQVEGEVVGTGTLVRKTHPLYAHRGELSSLVVHPHYQRQGIARRIVEVVCEEAGRWGIEIV
jgi:ribosomal protein S18 acetylase RimI-like enzyme